MMTTQVIEFNREILKIQPRRIGQLDFTEASHIIKCMHEEATEFQEAFEYKDFIGSIDALIDVVYFALGGLYKMGFTDEIVDELFTAVHNANMTKKKGVVATRDTGAPDAVKPEGWIPPEERIAAIIDKHVVLRGEG